MISIENNDLVRLILQFLKENNLSRTMAILKEETGVSLDSIDDPNLFHDYIIQGQWDKILTLLSDIPLDPLKLIPLYEQIFLEMLEINQLEACSLILRSTEPMNLLLKRDESRYFTFENLLSIKVNGKKKFPSLSIQSQQEIPFQKEIKNEIPTNDNLPLEEIKEIQTFPLLSNKQENRKRLAKMFKEEFKSLPNQRLLLLIGDAIKWQLRKSKITSDHDIKIDLFHGIIPTNSDTFDSPIQSCFTILNLNSNCESLVFDSINSILIGMNNGSLISRNIISGRGDDQDNDSSVIFPPSLPSPSPSSSIFPSSPIISMAIYSKEDQNEHSSSSHLQQWQNWMVIGTLEGDIHIIRDNSLYKSIKKAHRGGVTVIRISQFDNSIISGGYDNMIRVHGSKSGALLKTFEGHKAVISDIIITPPIFASSSSSSLNLFPFDSESTYALSFASSSNHSKKNIEKEGDLMIYSCSHDGMIIEWNSRSNNYNPRQVIQFKPNSLKTTLIKSIFTRKSNVNRNKDGIGIDSNNNEKIELFAITSNHVYQIVNGKFNPIFMTDRNYNEMIENEIEKNDHKNVIRNHEIINGTQSVKGDYLYLILSNDKINTYKWTSDNKLELKNSIVTDQNGIVGIKTHDRLNIIATFDSSNMVKLWK